MIVYALCILHGSSLERLDGIFSQHNSSLSRNITAAAARNSNGGSAG